MKRDMELLRLFLDYSSGSRNAKLLSYWCSPSYRIEYEYWVGEHIKAGGSTIIRAPKNDWPKACI